MGDTPSLSFGAGVGLRYRRDPWRVALSLHWSRALGSATSRDDVSLTIDRWSAALHGCIGSDTFGGCLVADGGLLVAGVSGATPTSELPPTLAIGPGAEAVLFSRSTFALRLYLDVLFTVAGATLDIERNSALEEAWSSPVATVVFGVAPTWQR